MSSLAKPTLLFAFSLTFTLVHCAGDDAKKVVMGEAGVGGEAGGSEGPASGGSGANVTAGAPGDGGTGQGARSGGAGESPVAGSGNGGAPFTPGAGGQGEGGQADGAGGNCSGEPDPTNCCEAGDPPCVDDWANACGDDANVDHYCCDAAMGARRSCYYDGDFYSYGVTVCLDPCTGKSFGTGSCSQCLSGDVACPAFGGCGLDTTTCENAAAGYMLSCGPRSVDVECVCDPDLP